MRKILLPLIIVVILILSGFGAAGLLEHNSKIEKKIEIVTLSNKPLTFEKDGYLSLEFAGTNSFLDEAGKPMLPIYRKTFEFSRGVEIKEVTCEISNIKEEITHGKIIPAPEPIPLTFSNTYKGKPKLVENKEVYQSDTFYPWSWYDYKIKCGLNNIGEQTTFLIVNFYPIRYKPLDNKLIYVTNAKIQINYEDPGFDGFVTGIDSYDMVIIAPEKFSESLQPLVDHKNSFDMKTIVKTVEEIISEYVGRDEPERIKYFIKDAKENWDITYVLLVGGLKSYIYGRDKDNQNHGSTNGWHVPVRYTNIKHSNEVGVISDLYFSDLYRYNESLQEWEFEDWDSDGDNIFAKRGGLGGGDELDLIPDIYVGRLACRNKIELKIVMDKIIQYESTSPEDKPWYKKMIGVAGRTFDSFDGGDQNQHYDDDCVQIPDVEWQEFVPRNAKHARIDVKIVQWYGGSPNLKLSIEKPLGTVLTFKELPASEIPSESSNWVSFDVPDVYLEPGEKYYITLTAPLGSEYGWCYGNPDILGKDRYPKGNSSRGSDYDWCFKTYDLSENEEKLDGEYSVDAAIGYMGDLIEDPVRIYSSNKDTGGLIPETEDIIAAFSEGAGYVNFEGHGNPISWSTHWTEPPGWTSGISITDFGKLTNGDKLPVVVVGGCHNALFNVSMLRILLTRADHDNWYWVWYPTPVCFSWGLCILPNGGAIACTGCTGLGLGGSPPHFERSGGLDCNFFYQIGQGSTTLGSAHSGAIRKYVLENDVVQDEEFCIVEFHLFGDPSLKLGGYE